MKVTAQGHRITKRLKLNHREHYPFHQILCAKRPNYQSSFYLVHCAHCSTKKLQGILKGEKKNNNTTTTTTKQLEEIEQEPESDMPGMLELSVLKFKMTMNKQYAERSSGKICENRWIM